jgi:hypothetical protein
MAPIPELYTTPNPNVAWKGHTFNQIGPVTVFNRPSNNPALAQTNIFHAQPIKHWRRELPGTTSAASCSNSGRYHNPRRLGEINQPGGIITNSVATQYMQDIIAPILPPEQICTAGTDAECMSVQANAKRRARSSGMIRKLPATLTAGPQQPNYFTTAEQRLYARNKTVEQNQITLMQRGDATITPGQPGTYDNVYASGTATSCSGNNGTNSTNTTTYIPVYYKPSNSKYANQGAVSGGERVFRLKYDTVMYGGQATNTPYGLLKPTALAYSTGGNAYRLKDKIGVDAPLVPIFPAGGGPMRTCASARFN